jgi:hypothetical protein
MVSQYCDGLQKEWKMANVHILYRPQQVLSQGRLPPPKFDQIVDSTAGYDIMALLDYFSGYHQIWLHREEEEEKTSFITLFDTYC